MLRAWYRGAWWLLLLLPLSWLYGLVTAFRRLLYRLGVLRSFRPDIPVIVVGNITLGGTGKSPLVAYLLKQLSAQGYSPGVVSRGYGAQIPKDDVRLVNADSLPHEVGDEPLMLHLQTGLPVAVSPRRKCAVQALMDAGCDLIITDDGLQHYALARDLEICVFDARRWWGNGYLLPAGPLREPVSRLDKVDMIVANGDCQQMPVSNAITMTLNAGDLRCLSGDQERPVSEFAGQSVHAIAGIGNPERFFELLKTFGLHVQAHAFSDHHDYRVDELAFADDLPVIMTEKDAVKCRHLSLENAWYLPVTADLESGFMVRVQQQLEKKGFRPTGHNA